MTFALPQQLHSMVQNGRIAHAFLFSGPKGSGKKECALAFAKAIFAKHDLSKDHAKKIDAYTHPDLHFYRPEGKSGRHAISELRSLIHEVSLCAHASKWKFFIVEEAERMLPASGNALLKTFEEPTPGTVIILLSERPEALLPTIISRCQRILFKPKKGVEGEELGEAFVHLLKEPPSFHVLFEKIKAIAASFETQKKEMEKQLTSQELQDLTPLQTEAKIKLIEGEVALAHLQKCSFLLKAVLEWGFQDPKMSYSYVEKSVSEIKWGLEHSIPLLSCLESLVLKLI